MRLCDCGCGGVAPIGHQFDVNLVKGTNRGSYHRSCAATYARGLRLRQRQAKEVAS